MIAELTAEMVVEYLLPLHSSLNLSTAHCGLPRSLPGTAEAPRITTLNFMNMGPVYSRQHMSSSRRSGLMSARRS